MIEQNIHYWLMIFIISWACITFIALLFLTAPYGKFSRKGWGIEFPSKWGWVIYETPSVVLFAWVFFKGINWMNPVPLVLFFMWQLHYFNRTYIYPFRLKKSAKKTPLTIVLMAFIFTSLNSYINARWISEFGSYPNSWFTDPHFIIGVLVFFTGWLINIKSDNILLNLRGPGETGYKIPYGGMFKFVSSPNYLGEILVWTGWAIATWSLAGFSFLVFTACNLIPRAVAGHKWYKKKFPEYPIERKAIIPGLI